MPFNGSGVFSIVNTFVPGTTIFSSAVNANFSDIATGLTTVYGLATNVPTNVRNVVRRNGGLEIWQKGAGDTASITVIANSSPGIYTVDGWYLATGATQASVVSQQAGLTDQSQFCARVQRNSGQTGTGATSFGFPLDTSEIFPILGQFVLLSLSLRAGANWSPASGNITIAFNVGTGNPTKFKNATYTSATVAISLVQPITTTASRYQAISTAIIPTTTRQAEITLTWTPVGTAGVNDYFEIDDVQIEVVPANAGYVASPFERLLFEEQLLLCQRYYYKTFDYEVAPAQNAGTAGVLSGGTFVASTSSKAVVGEYRYPVIMRIPTTPVLYNPSATNAEVRNVVASADCTASTVAVPSTLGGTITATGNASGNVGDRWQVHLTADAEIV